jgi:hypothetical protein
MAQDARFGCEARCCNGDLLWNYSNPVALSLRSNESHGTIEFVALGWCSGIGCINKTFQS